MNSRNNPPMIPGWTHVYSGKVRDLYVPEESRYDAAGLTVSDDAEIRAGSVMVVASDRISAFDKILPTEIPDKGKILTQMSLWWFQQLSHIPNHVISTDVPESVAGRAMICKSLNMFPVECIVRGYLTGSGLASYRDTGSIAGIELPAGLVDGSRLETPIFTPTGKAEVGQHDEPVTREELYAEVGHAIGNRLEETLTRTLQHRRKNRPRAGHYLGRHQSRIRNRLLPRRNHPWRRIAHPRLLTILGCE